jgi:hypothetical protein
MASRMVVEHERKRLEMENQNYEFSNMMIEVERQNHRLIFEKKNLMETINDMKSEYEFLKEGYDEVIKDNDRLKQENAMKDRNITDMTRELEDLKNVIGKLTEIRVILNKYFSSYFESFT